jgi:hypothetical protein
VLTTLKRHLKSVHFLPSVVGVFNDVYQNVYSILTDVN